MPKGAVIERLAGGFTWAEGPVWFPDNGGFLLFSNVPQNVVYRWKRPDRLNVYLRPSGYTGTTPRGGEPGSNGLLRDSKGRLVLMQHGDRRVARLNERDEFETVADNYEHKALNSPNDGVFKANGDLYFTDPPYGLEKGVEDPKRELDFQGVYRVAPDGKVTLLTKELSRPNGIAFAPDETTLYVANSDPQKAIWMAFPVQDDGTLGAGKVFADVTQSVGASRPGLPDGLKVDAQGNLFATGPGGVLIFAPDGTHLGTLATDIPTSNCAWGDDGSTLYIAASHDLARIRLATRGLRHPA